MATQTPGLLHQPDYLRGLAKQLRAEAQRAEARADGLEKGTIEAACKPGCWNLLTTCFFVEPA